MKHWLASNLRKVIGRPKKQASLRVVSGEDIGEEVRIDSLIYPLRYDVMVRAEFMAYYRRFRGVYTRDFEAFLAHPVAQAYFTSWSTDASRSRPHLGRYPEARRSEFEHRVRRAVGLFESLESSGFDNQHPIELREASLIKHEHDKHVQRRYYAGDGCHRLAFLASMGAATLKPCQYNVRVFETFQPRDNTYLLLGNVIGSEAEYCRIISRYYCNGVEIDAPLLILDHVERNHPHQLDEVVSVMRVDLNRFVELADDSVKN